MHSSWVLGDCSGLEFLQFFHCTQEDLVEGKEFEPVVQHSKSVMAKKPISDDEGSIIILDSDSDEEKVSI
jgi:hypothetical protein